MWMIPALLITYLLMSCFQRIYAASCYYPDGTLSRDVPCSSGADSACCGSGAICLSNGLCLSTVQPFGLTRGSCTDPSYKIKECTKLCSESSRQSNWIPSMTTIPTANIQINAGYSIVLYNNTESATLYCCNSIVNDPNGSLPLCDQGLNPIEVDSATSNTSGTINSRDSSSHEVAVGVGVGVPLGVTAAIFLVWALWERRSRLGIIRNSSSAGAQSTYALTNLSGGSSQKPEISQHLVLGPAELDVHSRANYSRS
jgi:hypothetical protein